MFATGLSLARRLAAVGAVALLSGCGGGCGNCSVPAYTAPTGPVVVVAVPGAPAIVVTPPPPGVIVTPPPAGTVVIPIPGIVPPVLPANQVVACAAPAVPLGPALAPFALLAASTITNVGNTIVTFAPGAVTGAFNDDLIGVSPGTAVTGFYPPGTDTDGTNAIYGAGYNTNAGVPLAAQNALTVAYNAAAAKAATATVAGDLSQATVPGHPTGTLPPGVYNSTSSLSIAAGNLTLDGGGNQQSTFVFQMASTLTTTLNGGVSGNVILINGANACNIVWQVGTAATLGGAIFYGNVLANVAVTINAVNFTGRALARTAAVTIPIAGGSLITNPGGP